ncbi:hypothetical protein BGX38DRAFT_651676 [Terfezia claveryi]|nr:hypothetical protein BGX38DRAFT_651676 [Terfezia claveryi]
MISFETKSCRGHPADPSTSGVSFKSGYHSPNKLTKWLPILGGKQDQFSICRTSQRRFLLSQHNRLYQISIAAVSICDLEINTASWWWDQQKQVAFWWSRGYGYYMSLGNINFTVRNKPTMNAWIPISLLPIPPKRLEKVPRNPTEAQELDALQVMHEILSSILSPLSSILSPLADARSQKVKPHPQPP